MSARRRIARRARPTKPAKLTSAQIERRELLARALERLGDEVDATPADCGVLVCDARVTLALGLERDDAPEAIVVAPIHLLAPLASQAVAAHQREDLLAAFEPRHGYVSVAILHDGVTATYVARRRPAPLRVVGGAS